MLDEPQIEEKPLTEHQAAHAAQLLERLTAATYIFNGTALALEQSRDNTPPAPELLEKLQALAGDGVIGLRGEGADLTITVPDLRALEDYASKDIVQGLETLTDLHGELAENEDDTPSTKRRIHFKGTVTPSQLARLYRLQKKLDLKVQLADIGEAVQDRLEREAEITVNEVDSNALAALRAEAEAEQQRRAEGEMAADLMTTATGKSWMWNGLEVVLAVPPEQLNERFYERLAALAADGIVQYAMPLTTPEGVVIAPGCHMTEIDVARLKEQVKPILDEAAQLLDSMTYTEKNADPQARVFENLPWAVENGGYKIVRPYPNPTEGNPDRTDDFEKVVNGLAGRLAIRRDNITDAYDNRMVGVSRVNIDELRAAAVDKEFGRPSPTISGGVAAHGRIELAPVQNMLDMHG